MRGTGTIEADWPLKQHSEWLCTEEFLLDAKGRGLGGVRIRPVADLHKDPQRPDCLWLQIRGEIECEPSPANRISLGQQPDTFGNPGAQLTLDFTDLDGRTIAYTERLIWQLLAQFGVTRARVVTGALSWAHHHMGTCRMGDDPRTSVVDRDLRVHGTPNLYVAGSAPFVTSGVSNPTLTITALSLRLADHLVMTLRA